ncbi:MAG: hypothetical protein KBC21_04420 [Candidatus Pacebacteria bacterium]|nr:hypothetical protein [Candidatus Paceibacterota bacterium]
MSTKFFSKIGLTLVVIYLILLGFFVVHSIICSGDWCDMGDAIMVLIFSFPGLLVGEMLPMAVLNILPAVWIGIGINTVLLYGIGLSLTKVYSRFFHADAATHS